MQQADRERRNLWDCPARRARLTRVADETVDVAVIGGGINGCAAAAALSAAGCSVALFERGDFASGTSMQSSNLAWGGIKYLENGELGLVRGLCRSRNRLLDAFPDSVLETRFVMHHEPAFRHGLRTLYAGAWLYWVLGQRRTKPPARMDAAALANAVSCAAKNRFDGALTYSDAWFADGDARFVFSFVRHAWSRQAAAVNYAACETAAFADDRWHLGIRDAVTGASLSCRARVLVNACGPWVDAFANQSHVATDHRHLFSKGVHLIVPRIDHVRRVLAFFADDGRLFFAIPFGNRTCIGTTDTRVDSPDAVVTDADRAYVLENVNARLQLPRPLTITDVISERCGVRPLVVANDGAVDDRDDWLNLSRRHDVEIDTRKSCITIYGGKLTDCVNVGKEVTAACGSLGLPVALRKPWYGEPTAAARAAALTAMRGHVTGRTTLPSGEDLAGRLWRRYGDAAPDWLSRCLDEPRLALPLADGCDEIAAEAIAARQDEGALCLDDFLARRTQLAACLPAPERTALANQLRQQWLP